MCSPTQPDAVEKMLTHSERSQARLASLGGLAGGSWGSLVLGIGALAGGGLGGLRHGEGLQESLWKMKADKGGHMEIEV